MSRIPENRRFNNPLIHTYTKKTLGKGDETKVIYENYLDNRVYPSQRKFTFPRKDPVTERPGEGTMIMIMCPNRDKALECISDERMAFQQSLTKRFVTDCVFREKIGTKIVKKLERSKIDAYYIDLKTLPLKYIPYAGRKTIVKTKKNLVNDISRWMEIFFARTGNLSVRKICSEFVRILKGRINDPLYTGYEKILFFDLNSWNQHVKSCVVMNKKLLNNPLSILLYTACYFPEYLVDFPNVRLIIANRAHGQIYFCHMDFITKKNYPKIKTKLSTFKDLVFSVEDEQSPTNDESNVDIEVKSEVVNSFRADMKSRLRYNLLGAQSPDNPFDNVEDITPDVADPFDELDSEMSDIDPDFREQMKPSKRPIPKTKLSDAKPKKPVSLPKTNTEIEDEMEQEIESSKEDESDDQIGDINLTDEISGAVDDAFETIEDIDSVDTDKLITKIANDIRTNRYRTSFMPERTETEKARIERLTKDQETVLDLPAVEDVKRKALTSKTTGGYIRTTNPNIMSSKFVNFDRDYSEKSLPKNIDAAVASLSNASDKIFITEKTVEDSSDMMNLKELHTYHMVDEKGNKMTIAFDVPKIIDGNYVFLNGTKKIIRHQLILKPIVKTGADVVQIVTAYNKVFIYRQGIENQNVNRMRAFLEKNMDRFSARSGNCSMLNSNYEVPLDYAMLSRYFSSFTIKGIRFYMSIDNIKEAFKKANGKDLIYDEAHEIPIGLSVKTKDPIMLKLEDSYTDTLYKYFSEEDQKAIASIKRKPKVVMACAKMMKKFVPLVIFMMYCEGFSSVMKKANINYKFITKKEIREYDSMHWDFIELSDGYIAWEKEPFRNELLMNGFKKCDMTDFAYEELESKDTFISLISGFYPGNSKIHFAFDNYRDFLLDEKTKEILTDFGYPTDLISLMVVAAGMLTDTKFMIENNLNNMRVRSSEVIADLVYITLTTAYNKYRTTAYKKKPTKVSIKRSMIIDKLLDSDTNMIEEYSSLNPILEIEKQRAVSFKGLRGIQMSRAMTLPRRSYDRSMLGTLAITTPTDANVGVNRTLTLEPCVTSTYGYIDAEKSNRLNELNATNLFSAAELLHPLGIVHDDPDRSAMAAKQAKYSIPVEDADPVLFGNKVEATIPYLLSNEFIVTAPQDGRVEEISNGYCVVRYQDGTRYAIDISERVQRNAASGFWLDNTLKCDLKVGQKFKEGDILAYNDKQFSKNRDDRGASLNMGALAKIAISSQWDVFEDSAPISSRLSKKLASKMVDEKHIVFSPYTHIDYIAKVGDSINAGDPLVIFSDAVDAETQNLLDRMREDFRESVIESAKTSITSKFTGTIADIKIYTTSALEDLDPTLRTVVEDYWNRIRERNAVLERNKNQGDLAYYQAGQVIKEVAEVAKLPDNHKLMGYEVEEGDVLILFYVKYEVAASKGDKLVCSVCKGIVSHVFEDGLEPYSEFRPDEPIDTVVAPLSVSARKIPNIFFTIFTNKLIIELKRQLEEIYNS